ncbi:hypothetical protein E3P99_00847 [Wallemia hederae]|uniref:Sm domain-containing protein n=1 Tax=Wallemia hederae TaxID=1540922 RepID=A0A4T0FTE8_9BASI|nr:hypothetical protein E3P99_00847 [Wallemia hederae]
MSSVVQSDTKGPTYKPQSPSAFLKAIVGKNVIVKLNSGLLYTGILQCLDGYMNLVVSNAREDTGIAGIPSTNTYGEAFISWAIWAATNAAHRGNNANENTVLYISAAEAL